MTRILTETARKVLMQEALAKLKRAGQLLDEAAELHEVALRKQVK